jgi:hypothetical protein
MNLKVLAIFLCLCAFFSTDSIAVMRENLQTGEAEIFFEEPLKNVAGEVARLYPDIKSELAKTFKTEINFRPGIILVGERDKFRRMAGSDLVIAFAVPGKNLIVLDTSRVYIKPFTLRSTLKHELCHLILHRDISSENLPRWFDEGVCQWASGGIAELVSDESDKALAKAVMSDSLIGLNRLERFPADERSLTLAYEESKSVVEYIAAEYGREGILSIVENMREGDSVNGALQKGLSINLFELEKNWSAYLRRKYTWFSYLSSNLYTILFALAALITVYGFIRLLKKKRSYVDDEEEQ